MIKRTNIIALFIVLFGFFTLNPLFIINTSIGRILPNDIVLIINFLIIIFNFKKLKDSYLKAKIIYFYLLMILLMTIFSGTGVSQHGGNAFIANMKKILNYISFFYILVLIKSIKDVKTIINILFTLGVIYSFLIIIQSISGQIPILGATRDLDSDLHSFFYIGGWLQFDDIGFGLARVVVPAQVIIVFLFLFSVTKILHKFTFSSLFYLLLFLIVIFINNSRGLMFGVMISLLFYFMIEFNNKSMNKKILKFILYSFFLLIIINIILVYKTDNNFFQIIWDRLFSAVSDIKTDQNNNWAWRMNEFDIFKSVNLNIFQILFGFGLYPINSFLSVSYMHFGPGDVLFRGGAVFTLYLMVYVVWLIKILLKKLKEANIPLVRNLSASLLMFHITWLGMFLSVNFLWNMYYFATVGTVFAMIFFLEKNVSFR